MPNSQLCANCGHVLLDSAAVCTECGSSLVARASAARLRRLWRNDVVLVAVLAGALATYIWGASALRLGSAWIAWINDPWPTYSASRFQSAVHSHRTTAVLFDADWCLATGTAGRPVRTELAALLRAQGHVLFFADLTAPDVSTRAAHALAGSTSIPCVAIFGPDGRLVSTEDPHHAHARLSAPAAGHN
jgi:thiol:disulfide interchange protein